MVEEFITGFKTFRKKYFVQEPELFEALVRGGQRPKALVISCCDSRVDPALLFGAQPGDLFVIRNVANLVPPYDPDGHHHGTSAALEFAVQDLNIEQIVVLGHSSCGGIQALQDSFSGHQAEREFIAPWVSIAGKGMGVCQQTAGARSMEHAAIRVSLANLRTFPWIREKEQGGQLAIHGWWFDMAAGRLWGMDEQTGCFDPVY